MSSRLRHITNWLELAHRSNYNAHTLARLCEVSIRQLERFTHKAHGKTPHASLREMRMRRALELICDRTPVKEVAISLGYKSPAHFSNDFKQFYGTPPSNYPNNSMIGPQIRA